MAWDSIFSKKYVYKTRDDGYGHPITVKEKNHFYIKGYGKDED